jgi:hypothetical protein
MNIREMHYDFKQKLNKIDSEQYRNLKVPEIDWKLNEAIDLFLKIVAQPKIKVNLGFEISSRVTDDIRSLVVDTLPLTLTALDSTHYLAALPTNYLYYVSMDSMKMKKGNCIVDALKIFVRQHDDNFTASVFDKSSFDWREVNIRFYQAGIKIYTEGEFEVTQALLSYIKIPAVVNNCEDYPPSGSYKTLAGVTLTVNVNCDLPIETHREIVDIAVAITTGDLQIPDLQVKMGKMQLNQL